MFVYQEPLNGALKSENKETIRERTRRLRKEATFAERLLWEALRNRRCNGFKFRRQHPIYIGIQNGWKTYVIADFCCLNKKMIIEVDGSYHCETDQSTYDQHRSTKLKELGYQVIRFTNEEVEYDMMKVLDAIKKYLRDSSL